MTGIAEACSHEGDRRLDKLSEMRVEAFRLMRRLARFRPRPIGSVWTGHVRHGSDIDIHADLDGTLGVRKRTRLRQSKEFGDLVLLRELERKGHQPGAIVSEVAEVLEYTRTPSFRRKRFSRVDRPGERAAAWRGIHGE